MYKLLNRFAWIISIVIGLQFSFFIDRDGPFDEEGFWTFIIVLLIVKFGLLSGNFIESRLRFFADGLEKTLNLSGTKKKTTKKKEEQVVELNEEKIDYETLTIPVDNLKQENIENEEILDLSKQESKISMKKEDKEVEYVKEEPSKLELAIKKFFSENLLAKLGGILVFLGVLFLLSLVYSAIGPVGKLIIGFAIGFSIYFSGVLLDKKGFNNEGRILLGIGILINYLVILGGRYLIGDNLDNNILSIGTTFLFLIINTVFGVVTSLVYNSRTLLLFSFIFAFLNPILIGGSSDNPYTLVGYSLIVSLGGLFLSSKQKDFILLLGVFILSNILFLLAPFHSDIHWITKLASSAIVSILSILTIYKVNPKNLSTLFIGSYVFLILLLGTGESYVKETTSFISYMLAIVLYFAVGIYYFLKTSFDSLVFLLLSPILIILGLTYGGLIVSLTSVLAIIVFVYLIGFTFIKDKVPVFLKYLFFIVLGIYIFLTNSFLSFNKVDLSLASFITVVIVSFVFIFTSYYLSTKKNLELLYSIGTIGGIFTLAPIIITNLPILNTFGQNYLNQDLLKLIISVVVIIVFAISNWFLPFVNKQLVQKDVSIKNLLIGVISGLLFIGYELFSYGTEYFPGVTLGGAFAILAIIYFVLAYFMLNKIGFEKVKRQESSKNIILTYTGISISVFSLAISLIFSSYDAVISAVWLFEATIMFYFYNKTKENKIFFAGIILFMIGVIKLFYLVDIVKSKDFVFLIPFALIFISYVLNVKYLDFLKSGTNRVSHDILHILGIVTLGELLLEIIPSTGHGWSILGIVLFLFVVNFVYSYFSSNILKGFFIFIFVSFLALQSFKLEGTLWLIDKDNIGYLRVLQYISTIIVGVIVLIWNKYNKKKAFNAFINIIFSLYLLIITSLYIYDIFDTTFAVTIYWGISASILLFYGIANDYIKLRTIGLYIVTLTALKVFLYDIWFGIEDAISRVVAFIVIGILFIVISTRYTKKYGNNIGGEFNFSNLTDSYKKEVKNDKSNETIEKYYLINEEIKNIDISGYRGVKFYVKGGESFEIRAENLIKIVKMITNDFKDITFKKGELQGTYEYVLENYKSELTKSSYDKILYILKKFVESGGSVEALSKK